MRRDRLGAALLILLMAGLGARGAAAQGPPGGIEPQLVLDNDAVRVVLLTLPPGSATGRHLGLEPELGIVLEGELVLVTDQGREVLGPGTAHWLPPLTPHDARNEAEVPLKLWLVLFKRCP